MTIVQVDVLNLSIAHGDEHTELLTGVWTCSPVSPVILIWTIEFIIPTTISFVCNVNRVILHCCVQEPATLDFVYDEDAGCQPLHFLCGATPQRWLLSWSWFQELFMWCAQQLCCLFKGCRSSCIHKDCGSDFSRAELLLWLIGKGASFDYSTINLRCDHVRMK